MKTFSIVAIAPNPRAARAATQSLAETYPDHTFGFITETRQIIWEDYGSDDPCKTVAPKLFLEEIRLHCVGTFIEGELRLI
jgi:hypothetical protein